MIPVVCLFLVAHEPEISLADLSRFPGWDVARHQGELCRRWLRYLDFLALVHGDTEQLRRYKAQTKWLETYWHLLEQARTTWLIGPQWQEYQLELLRDHIGHYRYGKGWHPELFPESTPDAPQPPKRAAMTPA